MQKRKIINIIVISAIIIFNVMVSYYGDTPDVIGGTVRLLIDGDPRELYWALSLPAYALGNLIGFLVIVAIFSWIWLKVSKRVFKEK